ncbi:asparagine synthase-related protein (plasmid) [Tistrella mobilis]|uniref:asparagine synthase-related protein n=1 Tax=Tistrella mobilis TaxID=171437 RepID=UPI0035573556
MAVSMGLSGRKISGELNEPGFAGLLCRHPSDDVLHRIASYPGRRVDCGPVQLTGPGDRTFSKGENHAFAFAGRLVNARELAADRPGSAIGRHDAVTAMERVRHDGLRAPGKFRGHFAFAHWDEAAGCLWLASDHLGRRTVFYTRLEDGWAFASSLRRLLALPGVSRQLDEGFLAAALSDVPVEPDATWYAAVRRVPAASVVELHADGKQAVRQYWCPDWGRRLAYRKDDDYVEQARVLLDQAVARGIGQSETVLCQLSGGFDSGAVAATAARLSMPGRIHALTVAPPHGMPVFEHPSIFGDERPLAGTVAAMHPNMVWETVSSAGLHPLDENPTRLFVTCAAPARGALSAGWYAPLFERARDLGARTILTGGMGNVTLSWDGLCGLASMARRGEWGRLLREARRLGRQNGISTAAALRRYAILPLLPPRLQARWAEFRNGSRPEGERFSAIHPDFARAYRISERRLALGQDYPGDTLAMQRRLLSYVQSSPSTADWIDALFGMDAYTPLADADLLEFCFAVPEEQYFRDGQTRWLARRVLADRLPPDLLRETRRGFQCAEFLHRLTLQREQMREGIAQLERSPLASRILDVDRMRRLMTGEWPTDAASTGFGEYGAVLHRGLHYGQFIRWAEGGNQ